MKILTILTKLATVIFVSWWRTRRVVGTPSFLITEGVSLEHHIQNQRLQLVAFRTDNSIHFPSLHFEEKELLDKGNVEKFVKEIEDFRDVYRFLSHELTTFTVLLQFSDYIAKLGVTAEMMQDHPGLVPYGVAPDLKSIWTYLLVQHPRVLKLYHTLLTHEHAPYSKYKIKLFVRSFSSKGSIRILNPDVPLGLLDEVISHQKKEN